MDYCLCPFLLTLQIIHTICQHRLVQAMYTLHHTLSNSAHQPIYHRHNNQWNLCFFYVFSLYVSRILHLLCWLSTFYWKSNFPTLFTSQVHLWGSAWVWVVGGDFYKGELKGVFCLPHPPSWSRKTHTIPGLLPPLQPASPILSQGTFQNSPAK